MKVFVGTSGWQGKDWNKKFFPKGLPREKWLNYLSSKLNSVEVNTTFYHLPKAKVIKNWALEASEGFVFAIKLSQYFTHIRRLKLDQQDIKILGSFLASVIKLKEKLGPLLIQLPPNFKADHLRLNDFAEILSKIIKKRKLSLNPAIEFRHESWLSKETFNLLKKNKIALVITNSPNWPSAIIKTADFVYVRFHGRTLSKYNYTNKELVLWAKNLKKLKPKRIFAYFNNDENAKAADNAMLLAKILNN